MNAVRFIHFHVVVFVCALCKGAHSSTSADVSLRGAVSKVNSTNASEWATHSSVELADATLGAGNDWVSNAAQSRFLGKTDWNFGAKFIFNNDVQSGTLAQGQYALRSKSSASELKSVGVNFFMPNNGNIAFIHGGKGFVLEYRHGSGLVSCRDHSFSKNSFTIHLYDNWHFSTSLSAKVLHVDSKDFVKDGLGQCEVTITTDVTPYIETVKLGTTHWGMVSLDCHTGGCLLETQNMKIASFGIYGQSASVKANI